MSASVVLIPVIISSWPALASAVVSACASAGFSVVEAENIAGAVQAKARATTVELSVPNVEAIADTLARGKQVVVKRQGVTVTFSRNIRGQFTACAEGDLPKSELEAIAQQLSQAVVQTYVHTRLMEELEAEGFQTVSEAQADDNTIHVHVRRYES